jgi:hypothetical protein
MDSRGSLRAEVLGTAGRRLPAIRRAPAARRWLAASAWTLATLAAFAAYLRLARTRAVNSDGASQALQAWDMLHGNPLLRGWTLTDVSFYTTELPQYMLVELVRGLGQDVVHVAAAMTYTLAVLSAALLAKGNATGREAVVRAGLAAGIMLAPQLDAGVNVLVSSPDHMGTSVPLMAAWLILDRARPRWYVPVVTSLLLAWAQIADTLVFFAGVVPLAAVCAIRVLRAMAAGPPLAPRLAARWYEIALGGGAVLAAGLAVGIQRLITAAGGYGVHPVDTQLAPVGTIIGHNLAITGHSLLLLPGADFLGLPMNAATFFVTLHLVGVVLGGCAVLAATWRLRKTDDLVNQVLLAGIAVTVAAFAVSAHAVSLPSAREIAPVLPFAAALAGRQLGPPLVAARLARRTLLPLLGIALAGYLAGLGLEISRPSAPPQASQLTSWLESHPLGTGLSGFWEANVVTLTSGERVAVHLVAAHGDMITAGGTEVNAAWYDPGRSSAHFVVLFPGIQGYPGFTARRQAVATFGKPARTYHVGRYTILYWPGNLLTELRQAARQGMSAGSAAWGSPRASARAWSEDVG